MNQVRIACDGACRGNPGPGAFAAVIEEEGKLREVAGADRKTTNNRMELLGAIAALESLARPSEVMVECDSEYVVKGMREWVAGWQRRGWRKADKSPVMNRDLWERLVRAAAPHRVRWVWVPGHAGHEMNERCDRIANDTIDRMLAGDESVLVAAEAAIGQRPAPQAPSERRELARSASPLGDRERRLLVVLHRAWVEARAICRDPGRADQLFDLAEVMEIIPRFVAGVPGHGFDAIRPAIERYQKTHPEAYDYLRILDGDDHPLLPSFGIPPS